MAYLVTEQRAVYRTAVDTLLQPDINSGNMKQERQRRLLACGLDELAREANELERALLHALNKVRETQGKLPVIVPKG